MCATCSSHPWISQLTGWTEEDIQSAMHHDEDGLETAALYCSLVDLGRDMLAAEKKMWREKHPQLGAVSYLSQLMKTHVPSVRKRAGIDPDGERAEEERIVRERVREWEDKMTEELLQKYPEDADEILGKS